MQDWGTNRLNFEPLKKSTHCKKNPVKFTGFLRQLGWWFFPVKITEKNRGFDGFLPYKSREKPLKLRLFSVTFTGKNRFVRQKAVKTTAFSCYFYGKNLFLYGKNRRCNGFSPLLLRKKPVLERGKTVDATAFLRYFYGKNSFLYGKKPLCLRFYSVIFTV